MWKNLGCPPPSAAATNINADSEVTWTNSIFAERANIGVQFLNSFLTNHDNLA